MFFVYKVVGATWCAEVFSKGARNMHQSLRIVEGSTSYGVSGAEADWAVRQAKAESGLATASNLLKVNNTDAGMKHDNLYYI